MATAKKLPSGSWRVQVYAGKDAAGKRQYLSFTRPTKKEAEYEALQFQIRHKEISRDMTAMTVAEAMDRYLSIKSEVLSPSTLRAYDALRRTHLQGLMDVRLNRLTPAMVQEAINQETKPYVDFRGIKRTPSPKSVRNIYGLLTAVLSEYYPDLRLNTTLPQKRVVEQTILEPEQIGTLLRAVEGSEIELPVLLAVWLCMRSSEITGLTWDCIDFERKTIAVKQALVRGKNNTWVQKGTKTVGSTRTLNAPDYIMDKLAAVKATATDDRVFPFHGGILYARLKTVLRQNDLPDIRFHDLRHTSASVMALLGIPVLYAQKRGGWSGPRTLQAVYEHTMRSKRNAVDVQIDSFFTSLIEKEDT